MRHVSAILLVASMATAAPAPEQIEFFEKSVRPVLAEHCYKCHGPEKQKGELRLDSRAAILKGADTGPVIVTGNPAKSPLIQSVRHEIESKMPDKAPKLPDEKIAALAEWVKMGLPWPENDKSAGPSIAEVAQKHWSFQPLHKPAIPQVNDSAHWARGEIDQFILAKLGQKNLVPAPIAPRAVLIRRASYDLTGLPPTADEIADFEQDPAPTREAFARIVDQLLASPQYGERWGRHWLDVARYADHRGYLAGNESREYPFAWTYRDWVIRAFNEDMPYDQFLVRQLAADLPGSGAKPGDIAALGFLTLGRRFLNNSHDIIDDRLDVVMRGTMSLTIGCARCHDHKFDPVSTKDYYALYGVFASCDEESDPARLPELPGAKGDAAYEKQRADRLGELRVVDEKIARNISLAVWFGTRAWIPFPPEIIEGLTKRRFLTRKAVDERRRIQKKLVTVELQAGAPPRAHVLRDKPAPVTPRVFIRGNPSRPGEAVPRRFPAFLGGEAKPFKQGSGRLELAQAITDPANPLTARVIVNRAWMHHFGKGLVATPGDFGTRSEPPVQAELLDWLAATLIEDGWSLKKLHRRILLSSTWMQDSAPAAQPGAIDVQTADPENRLLTHQNRRRLDWESLHDSLLAVAGELDTTIGGRPVKLFDAPFPKRRAVYAYIDRQNLPATLRTFDFASPDLMNPQRAVTSVPQQALYMMNSPFVLAQAEALADDAEFDSSSVEERQVQLLYERILNRKATPTEVAAAIGFVKAAFAAPAPKSDEAVWQYGSGNFDPSTGRVSFLPLPYWTGTAWQGGPKLPDKKLGWVHVNADGGHPARELSAIRRFIAPRGLTATLAGAVTRAASAGDGVIARIVSSRQGQLAETVVGPKSTVPLPLAKVELQAGETLDFIVESRGDENSDSFEWHAVLTVAEGIEFNSKSQFAGPAKKNPPLTPWEKLAQVLLETNEFVFVD